MKNVHTDEILSDGPPKDGIPFIINTKFLGPGEAGFLKPEDGFMGVQVGGEARANFFKILNWHEVVNDIIDEVLLGVSF